MGSGMDVQPDAERAPQGGYAKDAGSGVTPQPAHIESEVEVIARALALRGGYRMDELREGVEAYRKDAEAVRAALDEARRSSLQGEDHEAGATAAAKALYPVLHAVSLGDSPEALLGHAVRVAVDAYLSRVSPSSERDTVSRAAVADWLRKTSANPS